MTWLACASRTESVSLDFFGAMGAAGLELYVPVVIVLYVGQSQIT